jgi:hypothetical protein
MEVELVPIEWLKAHEGIRLKKVRELAEVTKKWGCYTKPLLVDKQTGTILDGHHRHQVGFILNLLLWDQVFMTTKSKIAADIIWCARVLHFSF